jgi:hypothetical protein
MPGRTNSTARAAAARFWASAFIGTGEMLKRQLTIVMQQHAYLAPIVMPE